jgi:hypothetical protein
MDASVHRRTPAHLWVVGALSLLWNAYGAYDYLMTRTRNADYLGSMGVDAKAMLAYIDSMPIWSQFGWGLGIWAAVLGSVLLLMRSRYAVHAFVASLVGMALSFGWEMFASNAPEELKHGGMEYVPLIIAVIGVLQLWYASRQRKAGVLR